MKKTIICIAIFLFSFSVTNTGLACATNSSINDDTFFNGTSWVCKAGFWRVDGYCRAITIPPNAQIARTETGWACNEGYKKVNNRCEVDSSYNYYAFNNYSQYLPENSHREGSTWVCNFGYKRVGGGCNRIYVPANAHLDSTGLRWNCNDGYQLNGWNCDPPATYYYDQYSYSNNYNYNYNYNNSQTQTTTQIDNTDMKRRCDQDHRVPADNKICIEYYKLY